VKGEDRLLTPATRLAGTDDTKKERDPRKRQFLPPAGDTPAFRSVNYVKKKHAKGDSRTLEKRNEGILLRRAIVRGKLAHEITRTYTRSENLFSAKGNKSQGRRRPLGLPGKKHLSYMRETSLGAQIGEENEFFLSGAEKGTSRERKNYYY